MEIKSCYTILGVQPDSEPYEIRQAFFKISNDFAQGSISNDVIEEARTAYDILRHPRLSSRYARSLGQGHTAAVETAEAYRHTLGCETESPQEAFIAIGGQRYQSYSEQITNIAQTTLRRCLDTQRWYEDVSYEAADNTLASTEKSYFNLQKALIDTIRLTLDAVTPRTSYTQRRILNEELDELGKAWEKSLKTATEEITNELQQLRDQQLAVLETYENNWKSVLSETLPPTMQRSVERITNFYSNNKNPDIGAYRNFFIQEEAAISNLTRDVNKKHERMLDRFAIVADEQWENAGNLPKVKFEELTAKYSAKLALALKHHLTALEKGNDTLGGGHGRG